MGVALLAGRAALALQINMVVGAIFPLLMLALAIIPASLLPQRIQVLLLPVLLERVADDSDNSSDHNGSRWHGGEHHHAAE